MRTSEEIYHRVRWDPRFDPARFVLGVHQRGAPAKRVALPAFVPGGDIPWHRVLFVEADGEVVWDRATGTDRLDSRGAGRARRPRLLRPPCFAPRTPYAWDPAAGAWRPAGDEAGPPREAGAAGGPVTVRVLTWNTLWDRYDSELVATARRRPLLLDALRDADADVVALQEVETGLLRMLLDAPWVRDRYTLDAEPSGRDVREHGLLLLSRLPVREAGVQVLGPHKALTALAVDTPAGPLVVAATHLSSDHSPDGAGRRRAELAALAEGLAGLDAPAALLGDFNDGLDGPEGPAAVLGMRDAWTEARGAHDRTPTFDPSANPLAAVSSLTGRVSRLDRVLLRAPGATVARAALRGDSPSADGLFPSDHYGVEADLRWGAAPAEPPAPARGEPRAEPEPARALARRTAADVGKALPGAVVHVVGSRAAGGGLPGADLDLVAVLPGAGEVGGAVARVSSALPDATGVRQVRGARVPGLRFTREGLDVDVVVVGAGAVPVDLAVARRAELSEAAAVALSAVGDAEAVRAATADARPAFDRLARQVKAWARARGLDSAPFGGLPGLAWTVLAARTVREAGGLDAAGLLTRFFGTWAAWDWNEPVALTARNTAGNATGCTPGPSAVTVLTPSAPVRSCTGQVTAGFRDLLTQELYTAWEVADAAGRAGTGPWPRLLAPPPLHQRHAAWAVLTVRARAGEDLPAAHGRFRGRVRALLTALDEDGTAGLHAWPRPFAAGPHEVRYAVGMGAHPPGRDRLARVARTWHVPGVDVAWAPGGAVPALA